MREYHVELGTEIGDEKYMRTATEPILARTDDEAILIASEFIRRVTRHGDVTTALLFSDEAFLVKSWLLKTRH